MKLTIPLRTYSEANKKEHWAVKAKRVKAQRETIAWAWIGVPDWQRRAFYTGIHLDGITVALTRIAPRELDGDNLQRSFKAIRDEVAKQLGVDDRDKRITWLYAQRSGKVKEYAVEIRIDAVADVLGHQEGQS